MASLLCLTVYGFLMILLRCSLTVQGWGKTEASEYILPEKKPQRCWPMQWFDGDILSDITFLELFPVVVVSSIRGSDQKIVFKIDNEAVVTIINKRSSKSKGLLSLVRILVFCTSQFNILLKVVHIRGKLNNLADSLSHCDFQRFHHLCSTADAARTEIPKHVWKI